MNEDLKKAYELAKDESKLKIPVTPVFCKN